MTANFIILALLIVGKTSQIPDTIIKWSNSYHLQYTDFKGEPIFAHHDDKLICDTGALTNLSIEWKLKIDSGKHKIFAYAVFFPDSSWIIWKVPQVLRHEQGHFDIAEIYAKRLEHLVNEEEISDIKEFLLFVVAKYNEIAKECNNEQTKYDEWTHNTPGQEYYYKWIDDQLRALKSK